jgi:hypothetical protein
VPPKPKPSKASSGDSEQDKDDGAAQQTKSVGQHAGDRASAVGDAQGVGEGTARSRRHTDVTFHSHTHADLTNRQGERGAHNKGHRARNANDQLDLIVIHAAEALLRLRRRRNHVHRQEQRNRQHANHRQDGAQLTAQVSIGAVADRAPNFLHLGSAFVLAQDLGTQEDCVSQAENGNAKNSPNRDHLKIGKSHCEHEKTFLPEKI